LFDVLIYRLKESAAKSLNVGRFMTEFGAISDDPKGYYIVSY
jgi:hypothetical protein